MKNRLEKLVNAKAENVLESAKVEYSFLPGNTAFPLVISPAYTGLILTEWIKKNKDLLKDKLHRHGAILFRGFEVDTVEKFENFINVFDTSPLEYKQRSSPRYEVAKNIYHSTTYPQDQHINMHSENSYAQHWAMKIIFCCIVPADEQGETPIADNRRVVDYLSPSTRQAFLNKGVRYVRNISGEVGLSWQEVFQTEDREKVEAECAANNMEFSWEDKDRLVLSWNGKAIHNHPDTNEEIWFNHAFFFNKYAYTEEVLAAFGSDADLPFNTCFGDGSEITKEEIGEIRSAYQKASVIFPWEKGDVLFMDNMLMAHGRNPYKGDRKIIVSMLR
ncbi:MAG TPA: TauD/TfdA family dioxygenase [Puia sp.]|nr:TauD/TfdA family dioxygenase [Puia sp.]